jgi:hypothetical protein
MRRAAECTLAFRYEVASLGNEFVGSVNLKDNDIRERERNAQVIGSRASERRKPTGLQ